MDNSPQLTTDERPADFLLSVAAPAYNEEESIVEFIRRCRAVLLTMGCRYELIIVNDGSKDRTLEMLLAEKVKDSNIKIVALSRNFGHQIAMSACIDHCKGDAVITMDADLQDPPELFPELVQKWKEGNDVVLAQRRARAGETKVRRWVALKFYEFLKRHSDVELAVEVGDFRLISRKAIDRLDMFREKRRYVRGLVSWLGLKQTLLPYDRERRYAGVSKYPLYKLVRLAIDGLSSFTLLPLRFTHMIGFMVCTLAVLYGLYLAVAYFALHNAIEGWQIATVVLSFLAGMQFVCIGLLSEYVAVIHEEVKDRPLYLVSDIY